MKQIGPMEIVLLLMLLAILGAMFAGLVYVASRIWSKGQRNAAAASRHRRT